MTKSELRKKYNELRKELTIEQIEKFSLDIANNTLTLPIWNKEFYHMYLTISKKKEIDTNYLLSILYGKDKQIVIPKTDFEFSSLKHFLLTDSTIIKPNNWNIPEPVSGIAVAPNKIDVVFVPLLAFDTCGHRVGYGKGFYDRFLEQCKPGIVKIGLSFFEAEEEILDINEQDIALDFCVTPERTYKF